MKDDAPGSRGGRATAPGLMFAGHVEELRAALSGNGETRISPLTVHLPIWKLSGVRIVAGGGFERALPAAQGIGTKISLARDINPVVKLVDPKSEQSLQRGWLVRWLVRYHSS